MFEKLMQHYHSLIQGAHLPKMSPWRRRDRWDKRRQARGRGINDLRHRAKAIVQRRARKGRSARRWQQFLRRTA